MIYLQKENIMNKCLGCGVNLQNIDISKEGYVKNIENELCERCFRIKNYNDYKPIIKNNEDYIKILNEINKTNDLVLLVVDVLNLDSEIKNIIKNINNKKILVLTKRDLIASDIYEEKILNYLNYDFIDRIFISSKKNYQLDDLMDLIYKYKTSNNVYVVGLTNAGKSTLINKIIYNYTNLNQEITTSNLPSTTLDTIKIEINNDLTLFDTPGILDDGNIINHLDEKMIKKIIPNKTIKPIVYQVKAKQTFIIDDILRLDIDSNNDLVFYLSNNLKINRFYKEINKLNELEKYELNITDKSDIVISGLGFIKVMRKSKITIYTLKGVKVYIRPSLI